MAQDRKVFVGGVPQDLNQDDLYAIFSEYAGVKKAWLQKCRTTDDGGGNPCPPQNHRGFGFVIFHDARAIDELLGSGASRFIVLRNGAKLEVKRALSSNKMGEKQAEAAAAAAVPVQQGGHLQPGSQDHAQQQAQWLAGGGDRSVLRQLSLMQLAGAAVRPPGGAATQVFSSLACADGLLPRTNGATNGVLPPQVPLPAGQAVGETLAATVPVGAQPGAYGALLPRGLPAGMQTPWATIAALAAAGTPMQQAAQHGGGTTAELPGGGLLGGPTKSHAPLRDAIVRFYHEHRPEKLTERNFIDFICSVYEGREAELNELLHQKYGTGLQLAKGCVIAASQKAASGGVNGAARRTPQPSAVGPPGILGTEPRHGPTPITLAEGRGAAACAGGGGGNGGATYPGSRELSREPVYAPAGENEIWLSLASPAMVTLRTDRPATVVPLTAPGLGLAPWMDQTASNPTTSNGGSGGAGTNTPCMLFEGLECSAQGGDPDEVMMGPDLSWIDRIVGDEISPEVAQAIASRSATAQRRDWLQSVVW